jgi:hypothetical protein
MIKDHTIIAAKLYTDSYRLTPYHFIFNPFRVKMLTFLVPPGSTRGYAYLSPSGFSYHFKVSSIQILRSPNRHLSNPPHRYIHDRHQYGEKANHAPYIHVVKRVQYHRQNFIY